MMSLKRFLPLALVPALALGLTACDTGGDEDDGMTTTVDPRNAVYDTTGTEIRVTDLTLGADGRPASGGTASGVAPGTSSSVTWSKDFTYILTNRVFVNAGQTLTIEPGTVIKGEPGLRESATALIVARGGTLNANGTATEPIIFTALADDVTADDDEPGPGSWGGLILLGQARTNTTPGALNIEGIPTTEPRALYGCGDAGFTCDDDDSSGSIRYVSVRYGGSEIGSGNEINGVTLGGVGRGTTLEYVEVFGNQDDGFEWFGGTVNGRYLVSAFVGDESFDTDQGYRGTNQFVFGIHDDRGDNGFEMDGGDADLGGVGSDPLSQPVFANVTVIGAGANRGARIKENAAPSFYRAHFASFDRGVTIEDTDGEDSRGRFETGDAVFGQNLLFGAFTTGPTSEDYTLALLTAANATFLGDNSGVVSVSTSPDGGLNPTAAGAALTTVGALPLGNAFLQEAGANCVGAVCPGNDWLQGWTALSRLGYLSGGA